MQKKKIIINYWNSQWCPLFQRTAVSLDSKGYYKISFVTSVWQTNMWDHYKKCAYICWYRLKFLFPNIGILINPHKLGIGHALHILPAFD